jgi:hypothetical protein
MATTERINSNGQVVPARLNWDIVATGVLANATSEITADVEGASWLAVDLRDTFSLTWLVEGTRDGTNYMQLPIYPAGQLGAPVAQLAGAVQGLYWVRVAGFKTARVRTTAWTSGSAICVLATCMSSFPPIGVQGPEPLPLLQRPAVSAAATAMTVTIPAAGVGLYHMIHQIKIWGINKTVAAVAPTAAIDITTTNLNAIAWQNVNDFAAWTKKPLVDMDIENGMRSQAANTATTIVIPSLGAGVSSEALVLYKVGG